MNPERQKVLATFVLDQFLTRPRMARNLSLGGLVLSAIVCGILISVRLDGAEGSEDIVVPAIIAGGLGVVCALGFWYSLSWIGSIERSELVVALFSKPEAIDHVEAIWVQGQYGGPALSFHLKSGDAQVVVMSEQTQAEFMWWLGTHPCSQSTAKSEAVAQVA